MKRQSNFNARKLEVKIKLTAPALGNVKTQSIRKFNVNKTNGNWKIDHSKLRWAVNEAIEACKLSCTSVDFFRFPESITCPAICKYTRAWRGRTGDTCTEPFESFQAGTVITIPVFILHHLEDEPEDNELTPPSQSMLIDIFSTIGDNLGISPWGSKFGYGRYKLLSISDYGNTNLPI